MYFLLNKRQKLARAVGRKRQDSVLSRPRLRLSVRLVSVSLVTLSRVLLLLLGAFFAEASLVLVEKHMQTILQSRGLNEIVIISVKYTLIRDCKPGPVSASLA